MKKSVEKLTGLSQHLRESWHTPNWKEVEILPKENNNVKQKLQFRKNNLLNKKEERKFISDIWIVIITQSKVN